MQLLVIVPLLIVYQTEQYYKWLLEIIGAAQSFNRERANSISSSIGIDNQIYGDSDGDDDDEVVIGDFSSSKYNRINPSYSRIRNQTSEL